MRIFATKQIECGGEKRKFTLNLFATAQFCEAKNIGLADFEKRFANPRLLDMMDLAYFAYQSGGGTVERDEFMTWFDHSELLTESMELIKLAFESGAENVGKPKPKASR